MALTKEELPGQMTVEFVVAFPAMLAIAFVAVNAILFFSDCAAFDRGYSATLFAPMQHLLLTNRGQRKAAL